MKSPLHLSLSTHQGPPPTSAGQPLLAPEGPRVVVGEEAGFGVPIAPSASCLFGPRGACLLAPEGPLYIADTGHHRVLGYSRCPERDGQPADILLGQPDSTAEGRNALGAPSACTFNVPTGVAPFGSSGLAVADAWNNRVLIWHDHPLADGRGADLVLGQADFQGMDPNRGQPAAGADTLHWPFAVLNYGQMLFVADAGNRRVLGWRQLPTCSGQPADFVLGQATLVERSDNGGAEASASSMRFPHGLAVLDGCLLMSDAGNNRILIWDGVPEASCVPASRVLGQPDLTRVDHNRGQYWPTAASLNMPYGLAAASGRLLVADTANSRLLGYGPLAGLQTGVEAQALTGQQTFAHKGDNRWQPVARDSLCWPYGISACQDTVVVADSGNHRVLLWSLSTGAEG